jgi:hypothetical protein
MVLNFSNKPLRAAHRLAVPANYGSMAHRLAAAVAVLAAALRCIF